MSTQGDLFGGSVETKEKTLWERLSVIGNMTDTHKQIINQLPKSLNGDIMDFLAGSNRLDGFSLLKIVRAFVEHTEVQQDFTYGVDSSNRKTRTCGNCSHVSREYKRTVTGPMAGMLSRLYVSGGIKDYIHITDFAGDGGPTDFSITELFGLSERLPGARNNGSWRLTVRGIEFVKALTTIPKWIAVIDGVVKGYSDTEISINDILNFTPEEV